MGSVWMVMDLLQPAQGVDMWYEWMGSAHTHMSRV